MVVADVAPIDGLLLVEVLDAPVEFVEPDPHAASVTSEAHNAPRNIIVYIVPVSPSLK
jgi:hypothetical protein